PLQPLLPDGDTGTQDQAWLSQPPEQLNAQGRLPGPGCRHDMQLPVRQIFLGILQDPVLVVSPASPELQCILVYVFHFSFSPCAVCVMLQVHSIWIWRKSQWPG